MLLAGCDDSTQNWYHSLACLRTNIDILKTHWADLDASSLQSDGAGNYTCTAFMTSVPRVGEVAKVRITDHAFTEVGDGKNLVDTDFQQVTMSLNQRKDGGADVETAQQILDNLNANPTRGTTNAAIDLSARAEGKPPKPYTGIDGIYWRVYLYDDATGACTGVRLHQFYGLGVGRIVSIGALRELWKDGGQLDAGAIVAPRLQAGGGTQETSSKKKLSADHAVSAKMAKVGRRKAREAKKIIVLLDGIDAERQRQLSRGTHACSHEALGCRRRFLSNSGAAKHGETCCRGPKAHARHSSTIARVCARVRPRSHGLPPTSRRHRLASAIAKAGLIVGITLKVKRPLQGAAYGLGRYSILPQGTGVASHAEVRAATGNAKPDGHVCAALTVDASGGVSLALRVNRPPLEPLRPGWAIKPPVVRTRYTAEQKALLLECFDDPQRPNERNAHERFKLRFQSRDGPFARALVMTAAKIKAWYGSEKQRRKKAAMVRFVAAEAQDEEDAEAAAAEEGATAGGDRADAAAGGGRAGERGRGRGRAGGRGRGRGAAAGEAAVAAPPRVSVAEMRAEMHRLGHASEAKAAKGRSAVQAALDEARINPREVEACAEGEQSEGGNSGSNSDEEESGEEAGEDGVTGEDVYAVQDIVAKRRRGRPPVTEYLIHWKGYSTAQNTWEPSAHMPAHLISEFNESRIGLEEETDNDDSEGDDSEGEEEQPPAPAPAKRRATLAAPSAPPAKAARGTKAAAGSRQARKRTVTTPIADSSDEEVAPPLPKRGKPQPKPPPKGKGKGKGKGRKSK